ncbi:uncharacterized protein [Typha latifolia]|uniref:uncharacterized protein n=1 Tax=Typha latifolia TaxID=4733 RepID=UPI003C2FB380
MAFHVACPITCRRVCYCELGFPSGLRNGKARKEFWEEIEALEEFLSDPWILRDGGAAVATVQVEVPRVAPPQAPLLTAPADDGEEARRAAMQRQAMAAEDYARRMETGASAEVIREAAGCHAGEDQGFSAVKVICRICFSGEDEGSSKAIKMLSCKTCSKKYHKSCLKSWAEYRDLFHWNLWSCPSCRICEVCRRTGDPNKLMFCKRCDGAYHCYCQQPPHKNVSHGPYLCPKHTRCHSCGSSVPGSGLSTRWFLGYTCCDACGRLFVKGNYCPVCLKVYRDSEIRPMVCCDVCERWVHCECDGISDEKYQQFQADQNLQYRCAACRGDCYQVHDTEDAVRELWKRKDIADCDLITSLRAAAGLPSQEEEISASPSSDDEQIGPIILKNDNGKTLKFSVKGINDKQSKNIKESGKNSLKKKGYQTKFLVENEEIYLEKRHEARSLEDSFIDQKISDMTSPRNDGPEMLSSPRTRSPGMDVISGVNQMDTKYVTVAKESTANRVHVVPKVKIKGAKLPNSHLREYAGENVTKSETMRGTKLVIHIGSRNKNVSGSPRSETSSCQRDQDLASCHGSEDTLQKKTKDGENFMHGDHSGITKSGYSKGAKIDSKSYIRFSRHGNKNDDVKPGKASDMQQKSNVGYAEESGLTEACRSPIAGKRNNKFDPTAETVGKGTARNEIVQNKQFVDAYADVRNNSDGKPSLLSASNPKPLLKLKFKNPYFEQPSSWAPSGVENSVKGQRSKRKRPSTEKMGSSEDENFTKHHQENTIDEAMDANWILQKLGRDAIGKRVEVRLSSDSSWHQGMVSDIIQGTSSLSVHLDDGRSTTLELGKQGIRFISQRHNRART